MTWNVYLGDCLELIRELPDDSVDSLVTDSPYHLKSIVKRFGKVGSAGCKDGGWLFTRKAKGFMGQEWDGGDIAFRPETWAEFLRVLKPGAHGISLAAARNAHRMFCAIEDGGAEVRDGPDWIYGTGYPKSHNIAKAFDAAAGIDTKSKDWEPVTELAKEHAGKGTALKPAKEPTCLFRKPLEEKSIAAQVEATGTGGLNVDECRVGSGGQATWETPRGLGYSKIESLGSSELLESTEGRWPPNLFFSHLPECWEECVEGCPVLYLEREVPGASVFCPAFHYVPKPSKAERELGCELLPPGMLHRTNPGGLENDPRWAPTERRNIHPTVKPISLMRWLCRLVTPPGGTILDPFTGSGTTGMAAIWEGFDFIGFEKGEQYHRIASARIGYAASNPPPEMAPEPVENNDSEQNVLF